MIFDANTDSLDTLKNRHYDVCICGTGPAGLTLAISLAEHGYKIALIEAGGRNASSARQDLYEGQTHSLNYPLSTSRLRFLGGTSNHWGGETRPLDARDFKSLPYHPLNEWPIDKADLDKYTLQTAKILDLDAPITQEDLFRGKASNIEPLNPAFRYSLPTRFGTKYYYEVRKTPNIDLYLNLNLVDIRLNAKHTAVDSFITRSYHSDITHRISATHFSVCCGALENARALLLSDKQLKQGVGNQYDQVGRYFCAHIAVPIGRAIIREAVPRESFYIVKDDFMLSQKCLSFLVSISSTGELAEVSFKDRLSNLLKGNLFNDDESTISVVLQQSCDSRNRVMLSDRKDSLGLKRIALDWQESSLDKHTLRIAATEFATALAKHDVGRMHVYDHILDSSIPRPLDYITGMSHPMCTTRMSASPTTGVVDKNCKVFGFDNLFVGGSSVFASGGVSNPTYTIVQLALRLSDHLHQRMSKVA
ncbi:MAG: FAD-binding protein [Alteromonadaceae bacterium]|nr:FAD-binding protein [Alteromonadaceae bacterium]